MLSNSSVLLDFIIISIYIIKVIKKNDKKEFLLLENKDNHVRVICRKYCEKMQSNVYRILTKIHAPNCS